MAKSPRDHGFGDAPRVKGAPRIVGSALNGPCPHCGCTQLYPIEVEVENPPAQLNRPSAPHTVIGTYVGCPACPYASPMMTSCRLVTETP